MSTEPWAVVRAAQTGDQDAFAQLYTIYRPRVRGFLLARIDDFELADDLTADTFLKAFKRLDTVTERAGDPVAWFITIARNLLYDHLKCSNTRLTTCTDQIPEPREHIASAADQWESEAARVVAYRTVNRCLAALNPYQREVVRSYYLATDQAPNGTTARQVRGRGVRTMRRKLAAEGITSSDELLHRSGAA